METKVGEQQVKKFLVSANWRMSAEVEVEAKTEKEALAKVEAMYPSDLDGLYVDESYEVEFADEV